MGDTKIEWADKTWNPIRGCSRVSRGCEHCYAETFAARFTKQGQPYEDLAYRNESGAHWTGKVKLIEKHLNDPLKWRKPQRVFVNSMSDLFHESIPDEWIDKIFAVMAYGPQHAFQVLTKRPARMREYLSCREGRRVVIGGLGAIWTHTASWPLPNVWLGVSVEDQKTADERIPLLLETPAAVRWISAEPLLGPVEFSNVTNRSDAVKRLGKGSLDGIHWVVVGGESGHGARPMHPGWARSLRDQCQAAGVPFFFKQWGEYGPMPAGMLEINSNFRADDPYRFGKKAAGRLLDGREWNEYPKGT